MSVLLTVCIYSEKYLVIKEIVHPGIIHLHVIQDVDEFVSAWEQI